MICVNSIHPTVVDTPMVNNEATYKLFRPDLENPTAEDFKAATAGINALPIPWVKLLRHAAHNLRRKNS